MTASQQVLKQQLHDMVAEIARLWGETKQDEVSTAALADLYRLAQSLADSGDACGAVAISVEAQRLEGVLKPLLDEGARAQFFSDAVKQQIVELLFQLRRVAGEWQPSDVVSSQGGKTKENYLVYLVGSDEFLIAELIASLEKSDYQVKYFTRLIELEAACEKEPPAAIIIDVIFNAGDLLSAGVIPRLKEKLKICPPVLLISDSVDIKARLAAAREGVDRYFCKPVEMNKLIHTLNGLITPPETKPYRVLLIDNDESLSECYAIMLRDAGMVVETLANPLNGLKVLAEFEPDVVVMDVFMPECSGPELVQIIRQDDAWALLSIIYLSTESNLYSQTTAMELGADDYLSKPVQPQCLVALVASMAKQARRKAHLQSSLKQALRENKFQLVTMGQHDIVSTADVAGRITSVNDRFCEISGYSREELLGQNHRILRSGIHPRSFYEDMWTRISSGKVWRGTICNRKKDGGEYWVEATIVPFLDEKGKPYKYVSARTDITALRQNEERLQRSQMFANIGTWDWSIVTGELYWSERIAPLFGYTDQVRENSYENFLAAVHPEDRQMVMDAVTNCIEHGAEYNIEHRVVWPDGSVHWVQESGDVVRSDEGVPLHMLGVVQDIDDRKRAELALAERQAQLVEAQTLTRMGNWNANLVSGELSWSDEIYRIFGYAPGSFEPSIEAFHAAVHPDDLERLLESENQAEVTGSNDIVHRIVRPDGSVRYLHELAKANKDATGKMIGLVGTVQDVTERLEMEERLSQQRTMLDMLHQSTTEFVEKGDIQAAMSVMLNDLLALTESEYGFTGEVFLDEEGSPYLKTHAITDISWNRETQQLYENFKDKGLEFRNLETLFGQVLVSRKSVVGNKPATDSRSGGLPEGHPRINSFLGMPIFYGNEFVGMYGIANRKGGYDKEIQDFLRPFDTTYGVMIHSKRMMEAEDSNRKALIIAKEEAENANRAKSQFLSSMSHELRTPMNAIIGFAQLMKMEADQPLTQHQRDNIDEIFRAGKHLLELINEVLDLAKIEAGRIDLSIEAVVLGEVVVDSLQVITTLAQKKGIDISIAKNGVGITIEQLFQQRDVVRADRTRLKQVLLNLMSNAVKYNREKGKLIIACNKAKNNYIRISISDTGEGLTPEQQGRLFQSFNRLGAEQSNVEGTGIGLVITKNIIDLMGGNIGVDSQPGVGSTFWIELPTTNLHRVQEMDEEKHLAEEGVNTSGDIEHTVLYVEDNPANLRLVAQLLGLRFNIHMWSAHEPLLGLELAAEHHPDLILLDINLPGIDGYEVLKRLRQQEATRDTPVIAISANAMTKDVEKGLKAGFCGYITKPIDVDALLLSVDNILFENK